MTSVDSTDATATTTTTTTTTTNMVIVGILVALIVVLTVILVILLVRPVMDFIRARLPESKRRKELRYRTVEGWLISKRLRAHDEACTHVLCRYTTGNSSSNTTTSTNEMENKGVTQDANACNDDNNNENTKSSPSFGALLHTAPSYDTAETMEQSVELEWKECPICMEDFQADEIVSWSPDDRTSCLHFFHHECIKGE